MERILILKIILSRLIFLSHGVAAVYLYVQNKSNANYWVLLTPLVFLIIESFVTVVYTRGLEYKYFWPSGFLYITCVIPIIWCVELDLYDWRLLNEQTKKEQSNYTWLSTTDKEKVHAELFLNAIETNKNFTLKHISELGIILGIIVGRWLMPRGVLTKDQLSELLLQYVGNAADILELFAVFEEPEILNNRPVIITIIFVFTWSMYQFSLVTTVTKKSEIILNKNHVTKVKSKAVRSAVAYAGKELGSNNMHGMYIENIRTRLNTSSSLRGERGKGKKNALERSKKFPVNQDATEQKKKVIRHREIHGELFQILVTLLMQDGPFLILRLYLWVQFSVSSEMHIFFTCKNAIVSILLVNRLLILSCSGTDEESTWHCEESEAKLHNIQVALRDNKVNELGIAAIYVK